MAKLDYWGILNHVFLSLNEVDAFYYWDLGIF
jgi:hypothetical protein